MIAGRGDNGIGVTGAAPMAGLVGLKILTADTTEAEDAEALGGHLLGDSRAHVSGADDAELSFLTHRSLRRYGGADF